MEGANFEKVRGATAKRLINTISGDDTYNLLETAVHVTRHVWGRQSCP
jgi:hypothetical protein